MKSAGLLFGLAVLLAALALTAGMQSNCKTIVMNYVVEEMCGSYRGRRSAPEPSGDLESPIKESRIKKRQAMTLSEIIMTSRVPVYHLHYPQGSSYIETVYVPVVPAAVTNGRKAKKKQHEALPKEKNSDLGFEMDDNELEELFKELYDRLPRSPNHDEFMKIAYGCCMDKEQCKSMRKVVDCP